MNELLDDKGVIRKLKKEIEEDIRAEVLGVENRNEPKKPEPPEIGSLI